METSADSFYSPNLRDHALHPRNMGPPADFTGHARTTGPCGDTLEFWLGVRNGTVEKAAFTTDGCAFSHAYDSVATCLAEGKSIAQVASWLRRTSWKFSTVCPKSMSIAPSWRQPRSGLPVSMRKRHHQRPRGRSLRP